MKGRTPTVHCDAEDGFCGNWDVDYHESLASKVDGVQITSEEPAPGWKSTSEGDFCPEHASGAFS